MRKPLNTSFFCFFFKLIFSVNGWFYLNKDLSSIRWIRCSCCKYDKKNPMNAGALYSDVTLVQSIIFVLTNVKQTHRTFNGRDEKRKRTFLYQLKETWQSPMYIFSVWKTVEKLMWVVEAWTFLFNVQCANGYFNPVLYHIFNFASLPHVPHIYL